MRQHNGGTQVQPFYGAFLPKSNLILVLIPLTPRKMFDRMDEIPKPSQKNTRLPNFWMKATFNR